MPNFIQSYDNSGIANGQNPGNSNYLVPDAFLNLTSPTKNLPFPGANSSTIHLEPRVVNFTTNTLGTTKQIYNTKLPSDIQALAEYFGDWGMSYQITEGPMFKFSVDVPWDSITGEDFTVSLYEEEQWELIPVQGNKSLTYSGLLVDPFAPMTNTGNYSVLPLTLQSAVNRAIKTGGNGLNPTSSLYLTPAQQTQYAAFVPEVNKILAYSYLGVDGVVSYTQQLKRTAVVDVNNRQQAFQLAADYATATINNQGSVNYILSTPDMIKNYTIRESVHPFLLPSYSKTLGVQSLDPVTYSVYAGWLVTPPTLQFIGVNKIQITQTFIWDEWLDGLYYISSSSNDFPNILTVKSS